MTVLNHGIGIATPSASRIEHGSPAWHLAWFAGVSLLSFLLPFVFSSALGLHHDLYLGIYFVGVVAAVTAYVRASRFDIRQYVRERLALSLIVGALAAAFVVWSVFGRIDSTPHPDGPYFVFEIVWRGVLYGLVDATLLSAFPGLIALNLFAGNVAGLTRRVLYGTLTFALVLIITAVYHAGYEDLRNTEGISQPEIGNTVISLPVIISANPVGSLVAHTSMHLAAVTHSYESKDRLPPQVFVDK